MFRKRSVGRPVIGTRQPGKASPAMPSRIRLDNGRLGDQGKRQPLGKPLSSLVLFTLFLAALILLVLSKAQNHQLAALRTKAVDLAAPALEMAAIPAGYMQRSFARLKGFYDVNGELGKLRRENMKLRSVKWNIEQLRQKNNQLKALLNSVESPHLKFVSGRVITGNPGLFGQRMLINLGHRNGISSGFAVINAQGFIGRTVNTGGRTSSVLLLTDKNSHVPVIIGKQAVRAMATGNGSDSPAVRFLPINADIHVGDLVFTSGHGGDLPKGLRIGIIKKVDGKYFIAPKARHEGTEYVSILFFDQPGLARSKP